MVCVGPVGRGGREGRAGPAQWSGRGRRTGGSCVGDSKPEKWSGGTACTHAYPPLSMSIRQSDGPPACPSARLSTCVPLSPTQIACLCLLNSIKLLWCCCASVPVCSSRLCAASWWPWSPSFGPPFPASFFGLTSVGVSACIHPRNGGLKRRMAHRTSAEICAGPAGRRSTRGPCTAAARSRASPCAAPPRRTQAALPHAWGSWAAGAAALRSPYPTARPITRATTAGTVAEADAGAGAGGGAGGGPKQTLHSRGVFGGSERRGSS